MATPKNILRDTCAKLYSKRGRKHSKTPYRLASVNKYCREVYLCYAKLITITFDPTLQLSDVPDNVQLQKDSDINLMEVLESLAPVPSEEVVALNPKGEGIERFRRRVEPASGASSLPYLPPPKENNSIFSQRQFSDSKAVPSSGEGEWDSGHAASTNTKKSVIAGEDASGSGESSGAVEQASDKPVKPDEPVVVKPAESVAASTAGSAQESSGVPSVISAAATERLSPLSQPPPVAISHNSVDKETSSAASTASFNAAEPEVTDKALSQANNVSKEAETTNPTTQSMPAASGSGEEAHPVTSAGANQERVAANSEASRSEVSADELAFIAGLQKAKKQQSAEAETQTKTKLPGSVGNDEDESDDGDDTESGDVSGEVSDSSASGDQDDEATSSGSAEKKDVEANQRSEVKQSSEEEVSGEDEEDDEESGSGSADDEDDEDDEDYSGDTSGDESQKKDTVIDVASGSGVSFISGVSQSESDEDSSESSGEDDEPEDGMPGSIGQVKDIEKIEQKPATPAAAPGFAFSSGSGVPVPSNVEPASGSGQPTVTKSQDLLSRPVQEQTKTAPSTGSGEEELPGSVGGIADIAQLEAQTHSNSEASGNSVSSASEDSPSSSIHSQITPGESLLQQVLSDTSSGSGESDKEEESLPGSVGGQVDLEELQDSSNLGSGKGAVQIVNPTTNIQHEGSGVVTTEVGSGEGSKNLASVPLDSLLKTSDSSGSESDEHLSGSGVTDNFQSLELPSSEDETLPGSVGAVGPNLMTMASPENKAGSGMVDQSGAASGIGSGMQEEPNTVNAFQFADSSGSGSGQVEKKQSVEKDTIVRMKVAEPVVAVSHKNETAAKANKTTIIAQKKTQDLETSGGFGFGLGSALADESLPGGFGFGDSSDLQSLAGSGGEDASGFTFQSGVGSSLMDTGLSASGSAFADATSDSGSSSSGSGTFSVVDMSDVLSKKSYAPTSASASASAEQDSGMGSGSGSQALPVVKHTFLPHPKRVGTGISSTTLASPSGSSSASGQSDSGASALPGSVGIEESFSTSGSAVFDASTSLNEGSGSGFLPNIAEFPAEDLLKTEESSASGDEVVNVIESGAGEGSAVQSSGDDGIEETSQRSDTGKVKTYSFNLNSALKADAIADTLAKIPINLGVGSGSSYGLGSGTGVDYGSASDFLSGSAGSGTLELTPATSPSDAIVDLFGNAISNAEKESDSESSSSASLSGEGSTANHYKKGKNRNRIPVSGDFSDESSLSDESEEKEQVRFVNTQHYY